MKNGIKYTVLVLAAVLLLSTSGLTADAASIWDSPIDTISGSSKGVTARFFFDRSEKFLHAEFTGGGIRAGEQYVILVVKGTEENYLVSPGNILYIDQTEASGESAGTVQFKVCLPDVQDSVILLAGATVKGASGPAMAAVMRARDESGPAAPEPPATDESGPAAPEAPATGESGPAAPDSSVTDEPGPSVPETPIFTDVSKAHWFYNDVVYVSRRSLMSGVGNGQFDPDSVTTRGMIMTILARLDGVDTSGNTGRPWYQTGMEWAMRTGVSDGTNPGGAITREQLAAMLWRYAGEPAVSGDLASYPDADTVSGWAGTAMSWAVQNGIISGSDGKLVPQGKALRSQAAAMLTRFCKNVLEEW